MKRWSTKASSLSTAKQSLPPRSYQTVGTSVCTDGGISAAATSEQNIAGHSASQMSNAEVAQQSSNSFMQESSLKEEQRVIWTNLTAAVLAASPMSAGHKGPPSADVLASLHRARDERAAFVGTLDAQQKEEVLKLMEDEKRQRKQMLKAVAKEDAVATKGATQSAPANQATILEEQKEIMGRAFWLYQRDQQKQLGSAYVDSTEWKRIRAIGGEDPTLRHYIQLAGWDASWPLPAPEGRAFRREQHAKLKNQKATACT
jgi:hypothetical protein